MKQKNFIVREHNHGAILNYVAGLPANGRLMVTISNATQIRSKAQNRLMHFWYSYIAAHKDDETPVQVKGQCKLDYGVPIMLRHEEFRTAWGMVRHNSYEKLLWLMEGQHFPVTSLFTVDEGVEYISTMQREYAGRGIMLPTGDDLYYEAMGFKKAA